MANEHMSQPLSQLKEAVIADGVIDAQEVAQIRERLYADGHIDREEAEFLFAVNDAVSGAHNDPGWKDLFVEAITSHLLEDEASPGIVDEAETDWLIAHIQADQQIDEIEEALLANLQNKARQMPDRLKQMMQKQLAH